MWIMALVAGLLIGSWLGKRSVYSRVQHCADEGMAIIIPKAEYPSITREARYALREVSFEESQEMLKTNQEKSNSVSAP